MSRHPAELRWLALIALVLGAAIPVAAEAPDHTPLVRWSLAGDEGDPVPALPYARLEFAAPWPVAAATVWIPGVPGRTTVSGRTIRFEPEEAFIPGAIHPIAIRARDASGNEHVFLRSLAVLDLAGSLWVDVDLTVPQTVRVYHGRDLVRAMRASAGMPGHETPLGLYYVRDRGERFFSERYGYGAYCWVRFLDNYLFHSVPVDREGRVIESERARLGEPASHGCIRLELEDARWFYENVPESTPVLIHP